MRRTKSDQDEAPESHEEHQICIEWKIDREGKLVRGAERDRTCTVARLTIPHNEDRRVRIAETDLWLVRGGVGPKVHEADLWSVRGYDPVDLSADSYYYNIITPYYYLHPKKFWLPSSS
jgi:hypothetical protein